MPHAVSLSPEVMEVENSVDDTVLPVAVPPGAAPSADANNLDTDMTGETVIENGAHENKSLEELFADDGEDDEFSSSVPIQPENSSNAGPTASKPRYCEPDVLRQYYSRLLPFRPLFQWLNHSPTPQLDFQHREFAFTLLDKRYRRYLSFQTADLFRRHCIEETPERFEIGPQYNINPRDKKSIRKENQFRPVMKELVFDIDMTDYDDIRTCCTGASICHKCWQFIVMAIKVVDAALREDFGFEHILWVYSGRRGAHAWVSDKRAREMDDVKRKAIAGYMTLAMSGEHGKKLHVRRPLHPHLDRSLKILNPYFQNEVLSDQDPWQTAELADKLINLLPDKTLTAALQKKWDSTPNRSSNQKWADIDTAAEAGNLSTLSAKQLVEVKQDIRLEYTYPRLDTGVSKQLNHLLKSPFVIHPGTGRVCVPIDIRNLESFDPFAVPKVTDLLREIDDWDKDHGHLTNEERNKVQDWQKTSVKPYVEYFRGYVANLLKDEEKVKRGRDETGGAEAMEF